MASARLARERGAPWTLRLYAAAPFEPAQLGAAVAAVLLVVFLGSQYALGRYELLRHAENPSALLRDPRIAGILILLAAYLPTAYVYLLRGVRSALLELRPQLKSSKAEFAALVDGVGRYDWPAPSLLGLLGIGVVVLSTYQNTPSPIDPYALAQLSPEVIWHRVLGPFIGWWSGRLVYAVLLESRRLNHAAAQLESIDLLDLRPLAPFMRQALTNALLCLGAASILSLFLLEGGFFDLVTGAWLVMTTVAAASLLLPLRGVRQRVRTAKSLELERVRKAMRGDESALRKTAIAGRPEGVSLADLVAYEKRVEGIREWPFDGSNLARLAIYMLIPLGSWAGGALVERGIDALLD